MNATKSKKITRVFFVAALAAFACSNGASAPSAQGASQGASQGAEKRKKVDPAKIKMAESYGIEKLSSGEISKTEFSVLLEAESAKSAEGCLAKSDFKGFSGEGYMDISDNTKFSLEVEIPQSQYYTIIARHRAGSHKENPILFNGTKVMDIVSEEGEWQETKAGGIFLEKGKNKITLGQGWSWFSLDSLKIQAGDPLADSIYEGVSKTLCNPFANLKTQNIYQYLRAIYGKRILAGQCTNYGTNTETDALFLGLKKYPALRTFDFIFDSISYCKGNPQAKDVELAIEWSKDGGLVVFDWHWFAPCRETEFYSEKTSFKLSRAVTKTDLSKLSPEKIEKLYKSKKISEEAYWILKDIDNISSLLKRMENENVTVMWRPLHEASGGWFWWGASGSEAYKWLWKLIFNRMTNYHKLDNLIWVWNAQDAAWYPGDEYCDIAAIDIYNEARDYGASPARFEQVSAWTGGKKMAALAECATMPDPDLVSRDNAHWLWFAVWNWDYIVVNGSTQLSDKFTSFDMMKKVYESALVITRDELPKELSE